MTELKNKNELGFLRIFDKDILLPNKFHECIGCMFSYRPKSNSGRELVSGATFLHIFYIKFSLYNTLSIDQISILDPLYFSRY